MAEQKLAADIDMIPGVHVTFLTVNHYSRQAVLGHNDECCESCAWSYPMSCWEREPQAVAAKYSEVGLQQSWSKFHAVARSATSTRQRLFKQQKSFNWTYYTYPSKTITTHKKQLLLTLYRYYEIAGWPDQPIQLTPRTLTAIVRVQAVFRGWLFRHRVLYNPHTRIGQLFLPRYLMSLNR